MTDTPMIEAEGLVKRFGETLALNGLDLQVPTGAILGVLGPNGAGKTTAVRVLTTLDDPGCRHRADRRPGRGAKRHGGAPLDRCHRAGRNARRGAQRPPEPGDGGRAGRAAPARGAGSGARSARPLRADRGRRSRAARLFGRHAPSHRPGGQPHDPPAGGVPRRAHHGTRPHQPRADVGRDPRAGLRRGDPASDHAVPGRGGRAGRHDRGGRPRPGDRDRHRGRSEDAGGRRAARHHADRSSPCRRSRAGAAGQRRRAGQP